MDQPNYVPTVLTEDQQAIAGALAAKELGQQLNGMVNSLTNDRNLKSSVVDPKSLLPPSITGQQPRSATNAPRATHQSLEERPAVQRPKQGFAELTPDLAAGIDELSLIDDPKLRAQMLAARQKAQAEAASRPAPPRPIAQVSPPQPTNPRPVQQQSVPQPVLPKPAPPVAPTAPQGESLLEFRNLLAIIATSLSSIDTQLKTLNKHLKSQDE